VSDAAVVPWDSAVVPTGIKQRILDILIDQNLDFFVDAQLRKAYDDGASWQHRFVVSELKKKGRLADYNNDYAQRFLKAETAASFVAATSDYSLPATLLEILSVEIIVSPSVSIEPRRVDYIDDYRIKGFRSWKPTDRPYWCLTPENKIRFYYNTADTKPSDATQSYQIRHIRDIVRTAAAATTVDLLDPWNDGPVNYAVAVGFEKQRRDPSHWFAKAKAAAEAIVQMEAPVSA
jgi:hypothetical protein